MKNVGDNGNHIKILQLCGYIYGVVVLVNLENESKNFNQFIKIIKQMPISGGMTVDGSSFDFPSKTWWSCYLSTMSRSYDVIRI